MQLMQPVVDEQLAQFVIQAEHLIIPSTKKPVEQLAHEVAVVQFKQLVILQAFWQSLIIT
jgi:hypothetical protein